MTGPQLAFCAVGPDTWIRVLDRADRELGASDLGTLVHGSALNLVLFSPTYGERMHLLLETTLKEDTSRTYVFSVSTSALKERITRLEQAADHLMFAQIKEPEMKLILQLSRLRNAPHSDETVLVPFNREVLKVIRDKADASRVTQVQAIRRSRSHRLFTMQTR